MPVSGEELDELEDKYLGDDHLLDLPTYLGILWLAADRTRFAILDTLNEAGNEGMTHDELADALDLSDAEVRDDVAALRERSLVHRWRESDEGEKGTHRHIEIAGYGLAALDAVDELLAAETRANEYFRGDDPRRDEDDTEDS